MLPNIRLLDFSNFPFFVVMTITPFPALAPHMDAAEASFSRVIDSTSFGFIEFNAPSYGKLSKMINGSVWELIELSPLNRNLGSVENSPELIERSNCNTELIPSSRSIILGSGFLFNKSLLIVSKEPVTRSFGML
ncbi:hypothetical protein D3C87_1005150 [compost metagenome]